MKNYRKYRAKNKVSSLNINSRSQMSKINMKLILLGVVNRARKKKSKRMIQLVKDSCRKVEKYKHLLLLKWKKIP